MNTEPDTSDRESERAELTLHSNRLIARWESQSAGQQFRRGWVAAMLILGVVHVPFIVAGRITIPMAIGYAVSEGLLIAGLVTLATQGELMRRRERAELHKRHGGDPD